MNRPAEIGKPMLRVFRHRNQLQVDSAKRPIVDENRVTIERVSIDVLHAFRARKDRHQERYSQASSGIVANTALPGRVDSGSTMNFDVVIYNACIIWLDQKILPKGSCDRFGHK